MKRKCKATTVGGFACRGPPLKNNPHCKRHDYSKRPRCNFIIKGKTYEGKVSPTRRCSKHINIKIHNSRCKYHRNKVKNVEVKNVEVKNVEEEDKMEKRGTIESFKKWAEGSDKKTLMALLLYLYEHGAEEQVKRAAKFCDLLGLLSKEITPKKVTPIAQNRPTVNISAETYTKEGKPRCQHMWETEGGSYLQGAMMGTSDYQCSRPVNKNLSHTCIQPKNMKCWQHCICPNCEMSRRKPV